MRIFKTQDNLSPGYPRINLFRIFAVHETPAIQPRRQGICIVLVLVRLYGILLCEYNGYVQPPPGTSRRYSYEYNPGIQRVATAYSTVQYLPWPLPGGLPGPGGPVGLVDFSSLFLVQYSTSTVPGGRVDVMYELITS